MSETSTASHVLWQEFSDLPRELADLDAKAETPFEFRRGVCVAFDPDGNPAYLEYWAEKSRGWSESTHWAPLPPPPGAAAAPASPPSRDPTNPFAPLDNPGWINAAPVSPPSDEKLREAAAKRIAWAMRHPRDASRDPDDLWNHLGDAPREQYHKAARAALGGSNE